MRKTCRCSAGAQRAVGTRRAPSADMGIGWGVGPRIFHILDGSGIRIINYSFPYLIFGLFTVVTKESLHGRRFCRNPFYVFFPPTPPPHPTHARSRQQLSFYYRMIRDGGLLVELGRLLAFSFTQLSEVTKKITWPRLLCARDEKKMKWWGNLIIFDHFR